jgi:hypothetical protein
MAAYSLEEVHTIFERIFSYPAVLRRHLEGPLASERLEYLRHLDARGAALGTVLRQARHCLCIVREIQRWPREYCFNAADLEAMPLLGQRDAWRKGRAAAARWPKEQFYSVAGSFLKRLGRLAHDPDPTAKLRQLGVTCR